MDINETKAAIEVMQAFVDGKAVQYRYSDAAEWFDANRLSELSWNWIAYDYRIKPEPKIIYVNEYLGGMQAFPNVDQAKLFPAPSGGGNLAVPYVRLSDVELLK